jgi:hypothetical protein
LQNLGLAKQNPIPLGYVKKKKFLNYAATQAKMPVSERS